MVHSGSDQRRWLGVKGHGGVFMDESKGSEGAVAPGYALDSRGDMPCCKE
jgi:hypothetical protein